MKFGFFDDKEKEYVITSPATPLPWINYLTQMAAITLSGIAIQSGHPPGSLSKQSLTVMNAVMDLVTAVLLLLKTKSRRSLLLLCR